MELSLNGRVVECDFNSLTLSVKPSSLPSKIDIPSFLSGELTFKFAAPGNG
jgi:hypothetical protein